MQEQLMIWHFKCQAERLAVGEPPPSLEFSVSKPNALRGLEYFCGLESIVWTRGMREKVEFLPRPWLRDCRQASSTDKVNAGGETVVPKIRDRDFAATGYDGPLGRYIAVIKRVMVAGHSTEQSSAEKTIGS